MAGNTNSAKGNPASKRMQNQNLKARRQRSWLKNQKAKAIRIAEALAAFEANEAYRRRGEPTPYEARRAAQKAAYEAARNN